MPRMNIADLYKSDGFAGLTRLARKVGASPKYLYQCATGRRMPSPALAWKLVEAEPRLSFEELYRDARTEVANG